MFSTNLPVSQHGIYAPSRLCRWVCRDTYVPTMDHAMVFMVHSLAREVRFGHAERRQPKQERLGTSCWNAIPPHVRNARKLLTVTLLQTFLPSSTLSPANGIYTVCP